MEARFVAWCTDLGQTEDFGSTKITGVFYDEQDAAMHWASKRDSDSAEYSIAGKGETQHVTVRNCLTGDVTEWEVCGGCEPVYYAENITSIRKEANEH